MEAGAKKREREHALGRRLLAECLKERYGIRRFSVELESGGKPCLASHPGLFFNITHTAGLAACAVGTAPLGLDAEAVRPWREAVAKKVLTGRELKNLLESCGDDRARGEAFLRYWTLKESYVKALGCGLRMPLTEVEFFWEKEGFAGEILCTRPGVRFWQRALPEGTLLALCVRSEEEPEICLTKKAWSQSAQMPG